MSELSHLERMVSRKLKELGVPLQSSDNELWQALSRVVAPTICYQAARELRDRIWASKAIQERLL